MGGFNKDMRQMSVLIVLANEPLPRQGGMERVTDSLARALVDRGVKVTLLCRNRNRLGMEYIPPCDLVFIPNKGDVRQFIRDLMIKNQITHIIDQGEGELIGEYGYFKERDACFDGIIIVAVQHSNPGVILRNYKSAMYRRFDNVFKTWLYNNVALLFRKLHSIREIKKAHVNINKNYDKIVVLSSFFIPDFIRLCKSEVKDKLVAIPNMNSFEDINCVKKQKRVLFVGRLVSNVKGCDKLLRIWKMASQGMDDWKLEIVGDGPDRKALEQQAEILGLGNVNFHGFQDPRSFYEKSQIFCMTSIYEGFGVVITEAQQHGCVPIGFSSYSSISDIIEDDRNGVLVTPFKEKEYAYKLRRLMLNEEKRKILSINSLNSVKRFSKENVIKQWINLLNQK